MSSLYMYYNSAAYPCECQRNFKPSSLLTKNFCCHSGGGVSHWLGISICACLWGGFFFRNLVQWSVDFHQRRISPNSKICVFWANYCKKHPIWAKLVVFYHKSILMGGSWGKNWYRESQIFEVRQAHPRMILAKVNPLGSFFINCKHLAF